MDTFYDPIRKLEGIKELNTVLDGKGGKLVSISGCIDTQKVHLASAIANDYNFLLIVSSDEVKARKIAEDAAFLMKMYRIIQLRMRFFTMQTFPESKLWDRELKL